MNYFAFYVIVYFYDRLLDIVVRLQVQAGAVSVKLDNKTNILKTFCDVNYIQYFIT